MSVFKTIIQYLKQFTDIEVMSSHFKDSSGIIEKIGEYTLLCSKKIIDPDPSNFIAYKPDDATIIGLFVKQHKELNLLFNSHLSGNLDAAWPLIRINYEAYIKMKYLIRGGSSLQRDYRLKSYKNRFKMYQKFNQKGNGVTDVFLNKFLDDIKQDGFSIEDFESMNNWKAFDGKYFESLLKEFEPGENYLSGYALGSDSIHSDWGDIRQLHLGSDDGHYVVKIEPEKYHGRVILACIYLHLQATESILKWYKTELDAEIIDADELVAELKRVSSLLMSYFIDIYENTPDIFVRK